jgi:uncharacterized protein (DUF169 family)
MSDYQALEQRFQQILNLKQRPVAVIVSGEAPAGVENFSGSAPAGCAFWRLAAGGRTFSTAPSDHYNCPIGSHTHHIPLPPERANDLPAVLETMVSIGYLKMEEVPGIPVLPETPKNVVYAPLGDTPADPDVVLFVAPASRLMMLEEAAIRAGASAQLPLLARPTCMAIPAALAHGMVTSAGCIGNRIYTQIGGDEMYAAVPGRSLEAIAKELETVVSANAILTQYHQDRLQTLASF